MRFYPDVTDQLAHVAAAAVIVSLAAFGGAVGCVLAGMACGVIRELTEASGSRISVAEVRAHFTKDDPWRDLFFWAVGGALTSLLVGA